MFENRLCLGMREPAVFRNTGCVYQEATGTEPELGYIYEAENVQIIKNKTKKKTLTCQIFLWHSCIVNMNLMAMKETLENVTM